MIATLSQAVVDRKSYSDPDFPKINLTRIPEHLAVVMDGNRRWAKRKGLPLTAGHWSGADALVAIVRSASQLNIKVLTVYALSTENMKRSQFEVKALMKLFKAYLLRQRKLMVQEGIRLDVIGDKTKLSSDVRATLEETIAATKNGRKMDLVLALNYGGRDEIKRAVTRLVDDCLEQKISSEGITEELISSYLDTAKWRDPDLLIRTGGENRMSNFLLWQTSYTEMVVTDVLWPDFAEKDLLAAIYEYQEREIRGGR